MTSSRIILRLALGVLCGVALVVLPAVFSTGPAAAPASYTQNVRAQPAQLAPLAPAYFGLDNATLGGLSLLTIILFILLPSTIFSILVRRWAEKKARGYLE